jgi:ketosteroid isomerase-like protein
MKSIHLRLTALLALLPASLVGCASQRTAGCMCPERREVLAVIQTWFNTMESRDVETSRALLYPDGVFVNTREIDGEQVIRHFSNGDFLAELADRPEDVRESMQNPTVLIEGDIAVVWTDYRFERNGAPSHTGIDVVNLLRIDGKWTITGGAYSVVAPASEDESES